MTIVLNIIRKVAICSLAFLTININLHAQLLYESGGDNVTGWSSFENPNGIKGQGGKENKTAKGQAWRRMDPGEKITLLDIQGAGMINRIWMTVSDRSAFMLRSVLIQIYWDGADKPAVEAPLGDFFGAGLGEMMAFQNALFSDPEGKSFNCYIPMPFRKSARVVLTNQSDRFETLFYDINFTKWKKYKPAALYFHAYWSSNKATKLGEDFQVLPKITGKGRFLGANMGIISDRSYKQSWWGEGEVKIFIDGDSDGGYPSMVGTGTEDYLGSAWSLGTFAGDYQGCLLADEAKGRWLFYRYHIKDPVYFQSDCKITIQQMGGDSRENVRKMVRDGAKLETVSVTAPDYSRQWNLLEMKPKPKLMDADFPETWVNFYRLDNFSATAYFYLDSPDGNLPAIAPPADRLRGIGSD
ncbi:MAG TPA: glycoside hydrolase family 172 protein [Arachidicoccus sp.]|nr:glycoside hydrolase family 172 protein [Arachidicoccus sp.]